MSEELKELNAAVDRFADAMKAKLAKKYAEGYSGWSDNAPASVAYLRAALREASGDPVDVGNFAMFLFNMGERTR